MRTQGARRWAIAEGYTPATSTDSSRELTSHETVCLLNAGDTEARVETKIYFADRESAAPYRPCPHGAYAIPLQ